MMTRLQRWVIRASVPALAVAWGWGALPEGPLDFSEDAWELQGQETQAEEYLGQQALRMRSGRAIRRDVRLQDGTIEFDMAVTPFRSFVYVQFRMQSDGEYEDLYFRPHKSGLPDAIQYSPVYKGASNWQLYHGPGYTAAAEFPAYQWIPVRVVLKGAQAAVFVGRVEEPQLVIPLARGTRGGYVALRGFLPGGKPGGVYTANFANLRLRPDDVPYDFSKASPKQDRPAGVVSEWQLSPAFDPGPGAVLELPSFADDQWKNFQADPSGLLVVGKHLERPQGVRRAAVLARLTVRSPQAATRRLNIGYSDEVSVFLNGRLLFSADDSYSYNFPRRQGLIGLGQASLYLPLEAGENEVVLAVTDVFGGWGVMGQWEE